MGTYVSLCEYCTDVKWVLSVAVWFLKKSLVLVASVGCWYHVYVCMYVNVTLVLIILAVWFLKKRFGSY
jgi:hypothetical protein